MLESPLELAQLPVLSLPEDLIWMKVKATSRVGNMVGYVKTQLKAHDHVLWSGSGPAVCKAMMSAELLKKAVKELHQETHCCYHRSVTGGEGTGKQGTGWDSLDWKWRRADRNGP